MRASRLLGLLLTLQLRGRVSAQALADAFEVSARTIYRDVDALSAAGVPIYAETGRHGGIALLDGWRTKLTGLTPAEAAALPVAGLAAAARALGVSIEAASAQVKLFASLSPDASATAQSIARRFHIDPVPWYHRVEDVECLPELAGAVWRGVQVEIGYRSWRGDVQRRVDPLGLVQKGGLWYLVASVDAVARTYRVSNITDLRVCTTLSERPARFDLAAHWAAATRDFEARLMAHTATVRISTEGERILRAVLPAAAESVAKTRAPDAMPGWSTAQIPFESPTFSARQLLQLGRELEVLTPESLRSALVCEAEAVLERYGAQPTPPSI
jgi:predicted DNA-binding transcriptional regulator YafY